jgi:DNA-binding response OmpR family regulator
LSVVLVVDDDALLVKMIATVLKTRGYSILTAGNGKEGLDMAKEAEPDIILLDIMMPVLDGLAMLEELRKTSDVPVIIISAFGRPEKVEKARSLGIECFLNKPFEMGILVEMLDLITEPEPVSEELD